ncbi:MAG: hypothetical protein WC914_07910 [Proteiniphilum sp.]
MGIKANFDIDKIFAGIEKKLVPLVRQAVAEAFSKACLEVVEQAKSLDTYQDQTNQLRSSIGYQIYDKGELITEYFQEDGKGEGEGAGLGVANGKKVAATAAEKYPDDIVGVIVAGADYALYVESKGYDVISGSASQLASLASKYLKLAAQGFKEGGQNG